QLRGDSERLGLAFDNLLVNAIKHSPKGEAVVLAAEPVGSNIRFFITDKGPGNPGEYRGRVFFEFFPGPREKSPGAGLGLYIASEVIRSQGGEIGVDSEVGKGSTFWFTLPLAQATS